MLVAAALVPDTALIVPGIAGAADVLVELREAAERAVAALPAGVPVAVVAPGREDRELTGRVAGSFASAGVPDAALGRPVPTAQLDAPTSQDGPGGPRSAAAGAVTASGTSVALHLLAGAGRAPSRAVEVDRDRADDGRADQLRAWGRALVADGPTALLVVGSLSARHGPDAPLADDPDAPGLDQVLLTALAGGEPGHVLDVLDGFSAADAARLAVSGWAPWHVLVGALGASAHRAEVLAAGEPLGAAHAVLVWRPLARDEEAPVSARRTGPVAR